MWVLTHSPKPKAFVTVIVKVSASQSVEVHENDSSGCCLADIEAEVAEILYHISTIYVYPESYLLDDISCRTVSIS